MIWAINKYRILFDTLAPKLMLDITKAFQSSFHLILWLFRYSLRGRSFFYIVFRNLSAFHLFCQSPTLAMKSWKFLTSNFLTSFTNLSNISIDSLCSLENEKSISRFSSINGPPYIML